MHAAYSPRFPQDERPPFRGYCLYKTGKCPNERALKTNGQPHNLCDVHRFKQNQNQRKMDWKLRQKRYFAPYERSETHVVQKVPRYTDTTLSVISLPPIVSADPYSLPWPTGPVPFGLDSFEPDHSSPRLYYKISNVLTQETAPFEPWLSQPVVVSSTPPRLPSLAACISRQAVAYGDGL
ncbi:unnamed protein product [Aphanomyces euteiches]|uniref:Uncharacterized protein n=1 Tax=Aphanomyces euteiches TaxID=100861 RepID=A0A6G0X4U0_9STRA|nr:hypothetical protein Ae201684_008575 [Aphanomyces euteiches]KAH9085357.1 hypothetical protein Ae201684P_005066 [Aphanomyces euteiches]KAH9133979.1 hypothetical protein AeRB84_020123 [Aphanomyces euteiches]